MAIHRTDLFDKFYARNAEYFKSKSDAKRTFDDIFDMISKELTGGNDIVITGFGKFWVSRLKVRNVRNPITQTTRLGEAKNVIRFTPSPVLQKNMCPAAPEGAEEAAG